LLAPEDAGWVGFDLLEYLVDAAWREIVVAVPVGPPDTCHEIEEQADETICLSTPEFFQAVGQYYEDFSQTTDEDVRELLGRSAQNES